jgi:hypothetical protein
MNKLTKIKRILAKFANLGCHRFDFQKYIENRWLAGMTWENYGTSGWHIDHIKPKDLFNFISDEEYLRCCHYSNLQPLWHQDNQSKGNKYYPENDPNLTSLPIVFF